jgi:hypothetical protein
MAIEISAELAVAIYQAHHVCCGDFSLRRYWLIGKAA